MKHLDALTAQGAYRLEEHEKDRLKVMTENEILKQKLQALVDQYEARDSHYNQQVPAMIHKL